MTLSTLDVLEMAGLFDPPSPIADAGLVLFLTLELVSRWEGITGGDGPERGWKFAIMYFTNRRGIEISGTFGIDKIVKEIQGALDEDGEEAEVIRIGRSWRKWDFQKEIRRKEPNSPIAAANKYRVAAYICEELRFRGRSF